MVSTNPVGCRSKELSLALISGGPICHMITARGVSGIGTRVLVLREKTYRGHVRHHGGRGNPQGAPRDAHGRLGATAALARIQLAIAVEIAAVPMMGETRGVSAPAAVRFYSRCLSPYPKLLPIRTRRVANTPIHHCSGKLAWFGPVIDAECYQRYIKRNYYCVNMLK